MEFYLKIEDPSFLTLIFFRLIIICDENLTYLQILLYLYILLCVII